MRLTWEDMRGISFPGRSTDGRQETGMIVYAPDYYSRFHCIADRCRHTCCEGWEIDIDPVTLNMYGAVDGPLGEKLKRSICLDPEPHFVLCPGERCPFLTDTNLCELILEKGEGMLCQICRDHPRFRNYWSDRVELGLGMVCEESARLILSSDHPLRLVPVGEDEGEEAEEPDDEEIFLREQRDQLLSVSDYTGPAARLREYLIYRHMADALYDGLWEERLRFVNMTCETLLSTWDGRDIAQLAERCRAFSNEVEYDDEKLGNMICGS